MYPASIEAAREARSSSSTSDSNANPPWRARDLRAGACGPSTELGRVTIDTHTVNVTLEGSGDPAKKSNYADGAGDLWLELTYGEDTTAGRIAMP